MLFCWLLWITARGAAARDGYGISVFTHLSGLDANSSCSLVSFTKRVGRYNLAACEDHIESGDQWCHTEDADNTHIIPSTPEDKNLVCEKQVMFVTSPRSCWIYRIHPFNFTFFKLGKLKRATYKAFAFSSLRQRLYYCTSIPTSRIGSSDFEGANQKIHVRNIFCFDVTVDDVSDLVFFIGLKKPVKMISRLTDVGYEKVKVTKRQQTSIVAHPGTKTLFVASYEKIQSVDYNGEGYTILGEDSNIYSLDVIPSGDMLYYGTDVGLYSFDLKTRARLEMLINFPKGWNGVLHIENAYNRMIISGKGPSYIIIFDPKTNETQASRIKHSYSVPLFIIRDCKSKL